MAVADAGKLYLESVVDQANLNKGVGELAIAPELGQQQHAGDKEIKNCKGHNEVYCDLCGTVNIATCSLSVETTAHAEIKPLLACSSHAGTVTASDDIKHI